MTSMAFLSIGVIMSYVVAGFWMDCVRNSERLLNLADLNAVVSNSVGAWAMYFVYFVKELVVLENV